MLHGAIFVDTSSVVVVDDDDDDDDDDAVVATAGFLPPLSEWRPPHWRHPLLLALLWMRCWYRDK